MPAWVNGVREQKGSVYQFDAEKIPAYLTEQLTSIRDFLYATAQKYVEAKLQIAQQADNHRRSAFRIQANYLKTNNNYATFEQVLNAMEKWHEELVQTSKKRPIEILNESLKGVEVVFEIDDNLTLYRLKTPEALDFESEQMGHCIGKGSYDIYVQNGMIEIYSIRDKNGNPHVTFEVWYKKEIHQCKGKQNKMPKFKYILAVQKVIQQQKWKIIEDVENTFHFKKNGKLYNLPKNEEFVFKGDIDLSHSNLTKLPDLSNVVICGSFNCSGNRLSSLEGSPQRILGDFNCSHNKLTSLKGSPSIIQHDFDYSYNNLTVLEEKPQTIGNNFDYTHNSIALIQTIQNQKSRQT